MKLIREHIDEAIKNMPGRTPEELLDFINQKEWQFHNENVRTIYYKLIEKHPFINEILEALGTSPRYFLAGINKNTNRKGPLWHFYFNKSASMYVDFRSPINIKLFTKYNISIQMPGNADYGFSITIHEDS